MKPRISNMVKLTYVSWVSLALLGTVVLSDDALKNHRAEKRQDDSFLFFGGWRPIRQVKSATRNYQSAASNRYHDILSALPNNFDAAANYYTHALPSQYQKDIYSYYPRPAIKSTPKKNTPVYMERYRPQRQQQKHNGGSISNFAPQLIDLQHIDLKQIKDLHEIILQSKGLPLSHLNLPFGNGKPLEIVEVQLQSLQQGNQIYGARNNNNNRYNRGRNAQRNNKGYKRIPQSRVPVPHPVQYEYITLPKNNPILPQILPKEIELAPIKLPHAVPSIQEVVDLKNVQIVEVPVPAAPYEIPVNKGGSASYSKTGGRSSQTQYRAPAQLSQPNEYKSFAYYAQQLEKTQKQYGPSQPKGNHHIQQHQPGIEAEIIKLDDEVLKNLLSNLQVLDKNPHDLLKHLSIDAQTAKDENIHLILSLPGSENNEGSNPHSQNYETQYSTKQSEGYGNENQYDNTPHTSYSSKGSNSYRVNSGDYHREKKESYQSSGGYKSGNQSPRVSSQHYENSNYQSLEEQSGYDHSKNHAEENYQEPENNYEAPDQYSKDSHDGANEQQGGTYVHGGQSYIQVISPLTDENGYRREPVLALEIQHGQTIEDALKSLGPETLQKIGAHSKDGIEIEVVEVPVDDYASESKKTETVVSARNSTAPVKTRKTIKIS